jgi:methyltransferase family protein
MMTRAATATATQAAQLDGNGKKPIDWTRPVRFLRRNGILRAAYVRFFRAMQALGISITPVHFYFPIPDLNRLRDRHWTEGPGASVVDFDLPSQLTRLQNWTAYADEWAFQGNQDYEFRLNNGFFETVDAEVAYSIVRQHKPKRVIEVGGGNSSRLLATALRKNAAEGATAELVTIEPHPDPVLVRGFPGLTQLIRKPVQELEPEFFDQLEAGDVLFLDSSHVVALNSDVVYEILEILPRLKAGVLIHFHDIFMPSDYPRKFVMDNLCFWGEQYMLQAFLCGNQNFRVVWSSSMMQLSHRPLLQDVFKRWEDSYIHMPDDSRTFAPTYDGRNVWPCSFWVEKVA